jgi:hypothetical protein
MKTTQRKPITLMGNQIGVVFLSAGILFIVLSVYLTSQILGFIGLGLTFWGALFLLITSNRYVESNLLPSTAFPFYATLDRSILNLKIKGRAYYIPPYPKDVFIPEHLKSLKDSLVFIPKDDTLEMPAIEEIAKSKFKINKPKGLFVIAPGAEILGYLEKKSNVDFSKVGKDSLFNLLPNLIINNLSLANEITISLRDNDINLTITGSVYQDLYRRERGLKTVYIIGCPVVSVVACAIAKNVGKRVVLNSLKHAIDSRSVNVIFRIVEA